MYIYNIGICKWIYTYETSLKGNKEEWGWWVDEDGGGKVGGQKHPDKY